jgi:hypothetical protein
MMVIPTMPGDQSDAKCAVEQCFKETGPVYPQPVLEPQN